MAGRQTLDGRYTLEEVIGEGGMGSVYRGLQHSMNRNVAVKVIDPDDTRKPDTVLRFLREAKLVSKLNHPNIVPVYDFGETSEGLLYLVMEHIEGTTLGDVLGAGPLPLSRAVAIATQVCDALEAAHAQAIVHRDLKPGNIMVVTSPSGRDFVRLLDFGIARSLGAPQDVITKERGFVGTPGYIAPEAARTGDFDQRSDIYSLGVLLYEMVAGRLPYSDTDNVPLLLQHVANGDINPLPEEIPAPAANVIMRMLAHDPEERYADAATVRLALEAAASEADDVVVVAPLAMRRSTKPRTETVEPPSAVVRPGTDLRLGFVAAGVLLIAIALLLAARWWSEPEGPNEIERAQEEAARELMDE